MLSGAGMLLRVGARFSRPVTAFRPCYRVSNLDVYKRLSSAVKPRMMVSAAFSDEERAAQLFGQWQDARRVAEKKKEQVEKDLDRKADERAVEVIRYLKKTILEGTNFVRDVENGAVVLPVSVPVTMFGESREASLSVDKTIERLFPDFDGINNQERINVNKLVHGFTVALPFPIMLKPPLVPLVFNVSVCSSRPLGVVVRAGGARLFRWMRTISKSQASEIQKRRQCDADVQVIDVVDPLAPITDAIHIRRISPNCGEAGQFVYLQGHNLLRPSTWSVRWLDQDRFDSSFSNPGQRLREVSVVKFGNKEIGLRIPKECTGHVFIMGKDAEGQTLTEDAYSVIDLVDAPKIIEIAQAESFADWFYVNGTNFGLDSIVYVKSSKNGEFNKVSSHVYSSKSLGFQLPARLGQLGENAQVRDDVSFYVTSRVWTSNSHRFASSKC